MVQEAWAQHLRQSEQMRAEFDEWPLCDGCGLAATELKWCPCRLKRYCSRDCQKWDFPAHKAECKKARGVA